MRIGIVVPAEIIDEIITFLSGEFPEIEAVPFPYHSIVEIPDLLSGRQNSVETFLFLGDTARRYAEKAVPHATEWLTIPRSSASLLRLSTGRVTRDIPCGLRPILTGGISSTLPSRKSG